jgi:hypothetical protein
VSNIEHRKQIEVSNTAHLFSMRTNGLSLKPRDRHLACRVKHSRHMARGIFLQPCPVGAKLFSRPFSRSTDSREIRRLGRCRIMRVCIRERDNVTYQLTGACGFIKPRLRAASPMLVSSSRRKLACSGVRDEPPRNFPHRSCVWGVKAQLWFCVKNRLTWFCNASKGDIP